MKANTKTYRHYNDTESYLDHFMIGKKKKTARDRDLVGPNGVVREVDVTEHHLTDGSYHRLCIATLVLPQRATEATTAEDEFENLFTKMKLK